MTCRICAADLICLSSAQLDMHCPDNYPLKGALQIGVCQNCGFVANVSPSEKADYDDYYLSINKHHKRSAKDTEIDQAYFNGICDFIEEKCEFKFEDSQICDFGSGALAFSQIVRSRGGVCETYDIGADPTKHREKDLVISTHTFEHIFDLTDAMAIVRDMAKDGGLVVVAVPDFSTYSDNYYGPYNHFDLEHINHFEEGSLRYLMERTGLEYVASRLSQREVRPGLHYSEILIVARRRSDAFPVEKKGSNVSEAMTNLARLLDHDYQHWKKLTDKVDAIYDQSDDDTQFVLYGLSSFAFRVLNYMRKKGHRIDLFADSDTRLGKYSFAGAGIENKDGFLQYSAALEGKKLIVIVAAVGSGGIVNMLEQFDLPNMQIANLYDFYGEQE